ncbi:MAG TPA: hypothetical protein PLU88_01005 [Armatimonadota bacterium]|nr:hypothetical protein [Armatimonadota bacterium]HPP73689.1 hypothetical protein [Armatimonadota bacterium]
MARAVIIAYWELIRIRRCKHSMSFLMLVPFLCAGICILLPQIHSSPTIKLFPALIVFLTFGLIHVKSIYDRSSGFAAGLDSTPAAGVSVVSAKFLCGLLLSVIQIAVFRVIILIAS